MVKDPTVSAGNLGSTPGSGRSPGEGNVSPLQYCCLENSMDRGAWRATVHEGHKQSDTIERLTLSFSFIRPTLLIAGHVPKTERYIVVFGTFS